MKQKVIAEDVNVTKEHLNAVFCGRKDAGVKLASDLVGIVGGTFELWMLKEKREERRTFAKRVLRESA